MGALPGLLGIGSGGVNWQAQSANLTNPVSVQQTQNAYDQAQQGITQQQAFVNALNGQNGLQNQSSVYNQLQNVASGQGPNPAQAMLNQSTGNNIAAQSALMAGQRGAGANAGLLARQAAQQGGALQQNAIGQGATLQANQSLGALGQLGGIAGQQVGQQQSGLNALNQASQSEQQQLLQGIQAQNQQRVAMQSNVNNANATLQNTIAGGAQGMAGGLLGGGLQALGGAGAKIGTGLLGAFADGGQVAPAQHHAVSYILGMSKGGKVPAMVSPGERYLDPSQVAEFKHDPKTALAKAEKIPGKASVKGDSLKNDTVKKDLDVGGIVVPRTKADDAKKSAQFISNVLEKKRKKGGK